MCPCNNINLKWLYDRPTDLLWADKVILTQNEWKMIISSSKSAEDRASKMIFERLQAEGLIQIIPDTIITPGRAESILQNIDNDLHCMGDLLSVSENEEESLLQIGKYSYCIPFLWSLYAAIDISRIVNASFSLDPIEIAYLMALIPRKFQREIQAGRNLAMDEVLSLYLPTVKLGHPYLSDSKAGRCKDCMHEKECSSGYMKEIEKQLDVIVNLRQYDEIRLTCEVMDKICDRSLERDHVLTGEELWGDLQEEAHKTEKVIRAKLPKIHLWSRISSYVSIGFSAASFLNPLFSVGAAISAIANQGLTTIEEKERKETSWVNFVNHPEDVLSRTPGI